MEADDEQRAPCADHNANADHAIRPSYSAAGRRRAGERMYRACVACHSLEPNRNMTGPSLAEVWNRKSGSLPSFPRYSPALKSAGIIWNDDTLGEWIKDPQHFIPGNTMTFPGIKDARQRADLLAFPQGCNAARTCA
jgi:cytochrome c